MVVMRTTEIIKLEILNKLNFIPPFFEPAFENVPILANLWDQTVFSYLDNPLPALFKEKLATLLSTYCSNSYCLVCHSSSLRPLGMEAREVLDFLVWTKHSLEEFKSRMEMSFSGPAIDYPEPGSEVEEIILSCCVLIFLNNESEASHRKLRAILQPDSYNYLTLFIAYNRTALTWAEAHPEISYKLDKRS
jgi:hypothetical protein